MNNTLQTVKELTPIAKTLREREEQITSIKRDVISRMSEGLGLMADQGRDLLLAKTKLGKTFRWSEWLKANVPNLPETTASKYERIATEQLADPRQCVFAFLPAPEKQGATEQRDTPSPWESVYKHAWSMRKVIRDNPPDQWPQEQRTLAAKELEPLAKVLWPDKF